MKWLLILLGVVYILMPLDAVPDLIAGLGWLDDLLLAGLIWYLLFRRPGLFTQGSAPQDRRGDARSGEEDEGSTWDAGKGPSDDGASDPYQVLGLERGASPEEIRSAYRRLAAQYHPDKVAHLGEEFQRLAEQKFKAIQAAYDQLQPRA